MMASAEGGVEIEEVAARSPEKILRESIDPAVGLQPFQARKLAFGIGIPKEAVSKAVKFMTALYRAFVDTDASMAEINPLVLTKRATCSPSTPRWASTTTHFSAIPTCASCAT